MARKGRKKHTSSANNADVENNRDSRTPKIVEDIAESDDEEMHPSPFCSRCGSARRYAGADNCTRQRRLGRGRVERRRARRLRPVHRPLARLPHAVAERPLGPGAARGLDVPRGVPRLLDARRGATRRGPLEPAHRSTRLEGAPLSAPLRATRGRLWMGWGPGEMALRAEKK